MTKLIVAFGNFANAPKNKRFGKNLPVYVYHSMFYNLYKISYIKAQFVSIK